MQSEARCQETVDQMKFLGEARLDSSGSWVGIDVDTLVSHELQARYEKHNIWNLRVIIGNLQLSTSRHEIKSMCHNIDRNFVA